MSVEMLKWLQAQDLGLDYTEAAHGVQTSIGMGFFDRGMQPKHMRTGIDMSKADILGLTCLLIDKGITTKTEYEEYIRLSANAEVHMREKEVNGSASAHNPSATKTTFR